MPFLSRVSHISSVRGPVVHSSTGRGPPAAERCVQTPLWSLRRSLAQFVYCVLTQNESEMTLERLIFHEILEPKSIIVVSEIKIF